MKICHLSSVHVPFDTRIFHKECVSLAEAGHDVCLVVRHDRDETVNGVRIKAVRGAAGRLGRMTATAYRVYRRALEEKHDVYHFHDPEMMPFALLLKLRGKRVVYDAHEDYPDYFSNKEAFPVFLRKPLSIAIDIIERLSLGFFDAAVTVTPKILKRLRTINKNTIMVCNFPFVNSGQPDTTEAKETNPRTLVYVGSLTFDRCVREMIRATAIVNERTAVRLLMGGDFGSETSETAVKSMPEFRYTDYYGITSKEETQDLYARASIGLVLAYAKSNYLDAYPTKMFEYMAAGLPVIAADFPLWRDIVESADCGLAVDPMNPEEIAAAIMSLLNDPGRMREMGENGRSAVIEKYSWEHERNKLLGLYETLTS